MDCKVKAILGYSVYNKVKDNLSYSWQNISETWKKGGRKGRKGRI